MRRYGDLREIEGCDRCGSQGVIGYDVTESEIHKAFESKEKLLCQVCWETYLGVIMRPCNIGKIFTAQSFARGLTQMGNLILKEIRSKGDGSE